MNKLPIYFYMPLLKKSLPELSYHKLRRLLNSADVDEPPNCKPKQISPTLLKERLPHVYARVMAYIAKTGETR